MKPPLLIHRFNPVVDRFVTTDLSLQEIIANNGMPANPMLTALVLLSDCLDGKRLARDAIQAAKTVPLKGQDPELTILLLARWAELAARLSSPSEAEALLHQARVLFSDRTHPEIIAAGRFAMSVLEEVRGNQQERETLMRQIVTDLPEHSQRRKFYLWELGMLLARQGRGIAFKTEIKELTWQCNPRFSLEHLDRLQFVDDVECGRIRAAAERMPAIATASAPLPASSRLPYREYQQLLGLMHEYGRGLPRPEAAGILPSPAFPATAPVWVQTVSHLLKHDAAAALKLARLEANRLLSSIFGCGFGAMNLIRAELASGHAEAAHRLLQMRQARGNTHYLDCLFSARGELLSGQRREAITHFREALDAAEQHEARGRLDFELALAVELPAAEARELTRQAAARAGGTRPDPGHVPTGAGKDTAPAPAKAAPRVSTLQSLIGRSAAMVTLHATIRQMASLTPPVLITGETGTGKELIARALHDESLRASNPFVAVNCGAISETLLESELFGHERGSFTGADRTTCGLFEDAGEGTLLLDEIGEVSPRLQTVLLRVLETGEVRSIGSSRQRRIQCRILAATNADLEQRVATGTFRQDLLYRLQRLTIHMTPLRERRDDIMPLTRRFLDEGRPVGTHAAITRDFIHAVQQHDWPGNVRELRNVIERMRLTHSDKLSYTAADLGLKRRSTADRHEGTPPAPDGMTPGDPVPGEPAGGPSPAPDEDNASGVAAFLRSGNSVLRRMDRLRTLFKEHHRLTRGEIVSILGVAPNTATKYLQGLCAEGFIRRVEPSASSRSHYFERV